MLLDKYKEAVIQWIPSHCGLEGNERADQIAKQGVDQEQPQSNTSYQEIKTILNKEMNDKWNSQHPGANKKDSINKLSREGQVKIFRLRTGHCRLRSHLYKKFKIGDTSLCNCNTQKDVTPDHILQDCPLFDEIRQEMWPENTTLQQKLYGNLEDLGRTIQFVRRTGLCI